MCEPKEHILFCTCNPYLDPHRADWVLKRLNRRLFGETRKRLLFDDGREINIKLRNEAIVHDLNHFNCFDFEYIPQEDDYLDINLSYLETYHFYFINGKWTCDEDGSRAQYYNLQNGDFILGTDKTGKEEWTVTDSLKKKYS